MVVEPNTILRAGRAYANNFIKNDGENLDGEAGDVRVGDMFGLFFDMSP